MRTCFVIMQIGDAELDRVFAEVLKPAVLAAGLDKVVRIDLDNQGGLLKQEIMDQIERADLIVADLTNERPNCYLEVGYAMGAKRQNRLILCAREDHRPDRPDRRPGDRKVHFDAAGYPILYWELAHLARFQDELSRTVSMRMGLRTGAPEILKSIPMLDEDWMQDQRTAAYGGMGNTGPAILWELAIALPPSAGTWKADVLREKARMAQIEANGWPIGLFVRDQPRPRPDGIRAIVRPEAHEYDYWALASNGHFYMMRGRDEGHEKTKHIGVEVLIWHATEALVYAGRIYPSLGVDPSTEILVASRYWGLQHKSVTSRYGPRHMEIRDLVCDVNEAGASVTGPLSDLATDTQKSLGPKFLSAVRHLSEPILGLFSFLSVDDSWYSEAISLWLKQNLGAVLR